MPQAAGTTFSQSWLDVEVVVPLQTISAKPVPPGAVLGEVKSSWDESALAGTQPTGPISSRFSFFNPLLRKTTAMFAEELRPRGLRCSPK